MKRLICRIPVTSAKAQDRKTPSPNSSVTFLDLHAADLLYVQITELWKHHHTTCTYVVALEVVAAWK